MVNTEDFIKRLEFILDYYSLSASGFADKIGVQRSSLSHLLSGRNKPSLDFILKILEVFPEVDLYWILNGKGSFPKTIALDSGKSNSERKDTAPTPIPENSVVQNLFNAIEISQSQKKIATQENSPVLTHQNKIEKIVIFYTDGKFEEFNPR